MKLNVTALARRPKTYLETEIAASFGKAYPFRFVKRDGLTPYKTADCVRELREKYLEEGCPFPPFGSGAEEIEVTEAMIEQIAPLVVLQAPAQGEGYTFEEMVWLAATEEALWSALQIFFWKSQYGPSEPDEKTAGERLGELSGAPTPSA